MNDRYFLELDEKGRVLFRYDKMVNHNDIPKTAIPVSFNTFTQTLTKQQGTPWLLPDGTVEFHPHHGLSGAELDAKNERIWRDNQVDSIKWLRERHRDQIEIEALTTLTGTQYRELMIYLQELRDWPQSADFPAIQSRPSVPEWIANQTQ